MAESLASLRTALPIRRPSMFHALGELRLPLEVTVGWLGALTYPWPHADPANRKVVMLIPGFMASDMTLAPLANFCRWLGHSAEFGGIWSNSRCPRDTMTQLSTRLARIHQRHESPVVIIGQSLGGVYAREIARINPEKVERVISLGSPIRTARYSSNAAVQAVARSIAALRGKSEGCLSETCKCGVSFSDDLPAGLPITLVYSRTDGIVHWESCIDNSESELVENVEVMGTHVGMGINPDVYRVIADRLAMPHRPRLRLATADSSPLRAADRIRH
jgi:pimeloyl-ACP methyl ester carboxylesterase